MQGPISQEQAGIDPYEIDMEIERELECVQKPATGVRMRATVQPVPHFVVSVECVRPRLRTCDASDSVG